MTVHIASHTTIEAPFRLDSIVEAPAPDGNSGVWQRYVITQGENTIVGMRSGMPGEVRAIVDDLVDRLNARFAKRQAKLGR